MDDSALLRAYVEHADERAFARLVEAHIGVVYGAALRQVGGDAARAQEVTHLVFIELARKSRSLVGHPVLVAWLHRTTRWKAAELLRSERRRGIWEMKAGQEHELRSGPAAPPDVRTAEEAVDWERLRPLLDEAVDGLRGADREAVLLRYFANWPFTKIGVTLGLSENAARMRTERAIEKLRATLAKRGVKSTATLLAGAIAAKGAVAPPPALLGSATAAGLAAGAPVVAAAALAAGGVLLMTKVAMVALGALTLGLAGGVAWQWQQKRVSPAPPAVAEAPREVPGPVVPGVAAAAPAAGATPPRSPADDDTGLTPAQLERARLDLLIRKGELDKTHAALFRRLKLPPEKLDALKTLIVERNQAEFDAKKIAETQGLTGFTAAERAGLANTATAEIDQQLQQLLGAHDFEYLRFYQDTIPLRGGLAGFLAPVAAGAADGDELLDELTRRFVADNPDHRDLIDGKNAPGLTDRLQRFFVALDAPDLAELAQAAHRSALIGQQLELLLREAALKGKLTNLTNGSARDYLVPTRPSANPAP